MGVSSCQKEGIAFSFASGEPFFSELQIKA
jgi:hypothetical protein